MSFARLALRYALVFDAKRGETSSKAGPSKNTKDDDPLITKDTNTKQQDTGKKKISNIASPNPFTALGGQALLLRRFPMFSVASWNIRGLNQSPKQKDVREVVNENNLNVFTILESHVDMAAVYDTCKKVCSRWKWTSNGSLCSKGSRIILGWNDDLVDVMIMAQTNQVMHVQVNTRADHKTLFCSFVYADDYYIDRHVLWTNLDGHAGLMRNRPWVLLGDFNPALNLEDHSAGGYEPNAAMREFKDNLHEWVNKIRIELDEAQKDIDRDPSSSILREEHAHYFLDFKEAQLDEERFLKQKAKIEWLKAGSQCFVNHYNQFLGAEGVTIPLDDHDLFTRVLDDAKADFMVRDVSNDEVKSVIFSMGDDRAPSPNSFTAAFFKKAWDVVGGDITCAVRDFFFNGNLLKELNHTIISLIPKFTTPVRINDYRPISCCNVLYKCISKIIANRVKKGLGDIVSVNQSAFVPGRRISDNILLTQELMRNYHRRRGPPRVHESDDFQYHHLCSGLVPSIPKSTTFFCNVPNTIKASILNSMPFAEGVLPVSVKGKIKKGKAKVAWDSVCMPKHEGGLGIRRIYDFNVALMATHIWSILTHKESLWVKWVHTYKLKGRSFWDVPYRGDINNGKSTSAWFDRWADLCPLKDMFSNRDIARSSFSLDDSLNNLISNGVWRWPLDWISRFLIMAQLQVPLLIDDIDIVILWRGTDGVLGPFLVACAWDTIRTRADIQKLKTQDRLRQWDVGPSIDLNLLRCPLCDLVPDSHDHLFFECAFSSQVWSKVRVLCGIDSIPPRLIDVSTFINPISKFKKAVNILSRLVLAATSYYIWLERNGRLFKKKTSSPDQIIDVIISMVQLKLVTFKFKKMSTRSRLLLDQWKIPSFCIVHNRSSSCVAAGLRDARLILCSHLGSCLA
ncbi:sodium/hydrogen exchanger 6 [Tanacetum coccineum]